MSRYIKDIGQLQYGTERVWKLHPHHCNILCFCVFVESDYLNLRHQCGGMISISSQLILTPTVSLRLVTFLQCTSTIVILGPLRRYQSITNKTILSSCIIKSSLIVQLLAIMLLYGLDSKRRSIPNYAFGHSVEIATSRQSPISQRKKESHSLFSD